MSRAKHPHHVDGQMIALEVQDIGPHLVQHEGMGKMLSNAMDETGNGHGACPDFLPENV